jgi:hypothetical protein
VKSCPITGSIRRRNIKAEVKNRETLLLTIRFIESPLGKTIAKTNISNIVKLYNKDDGTIISYRPPAKSKKFIRKIIISQDRFDLKNLPRQMAIIRVTEIKKGSG